VVTKDDELPGGVELAKAIEALRFQLTNAMEASPGQGLRFRPGPIELTVQAALTNSGGGEFGIKWWLFEAGGDVSRKSVVTQRLKISLQPVLLDDKGGIIDAIISGVESPPMKNPGLDEHPSGATE